MSYDYVKIVIGIDQSYQDTGIAVVADRKLKNAWSVKLKKFSDNTERRSVLKQSLTEVLKLVQGRSQYVQVLIERIRLQTKGFVNINYIKSIGALNACIVDTVSEFDTLGVFSVDTRSWKSQVVGTSKPKSNKFGIEPEKYPTICYVRKQGFDCYIREEAGKQKKKGVIEINGQRFVYNDNVADAICIAQYGFLHRSQQKLEAEH